MKPLRASRIPRPALDERGRFAATLALFLLLGFVRSIVAQGSPDIVWQGSHASNVTFTAFSPDSQQLASGGDDRKDNLWRVADGTLIRSITQCGGIGCRGSTFGIYSSDGQQLATTGIKFWNVADGTLARTLSLGGIIAFSPDWQFIASSVTVRNYPSQTRSITLVRSSDGSQVWQSSNYGGGATVFSPDGQWLATIGFQGVDILRVSDGTLIRNIVGPRGGALAISHDGQFLATNGGAGGSFQWDDTIKIYRVADGALVRTFSGTGVVTSIAFTPDDQTLIAGSWDSNYDPVNGYIPATGSIRFWRLSDGVLFKTYDQNTGTSANTLSVSPDGKFFSYSHDSTLVVARIPASSCGFSVSPGGANWPREGGSGAVNVSAPAGCAWKAVSRVNWITINGPSSGTGNGMISYTATGGSSDMTGLLIVAEQTFPIRLGADPCTYTVSPDGSSWSADGGTAQLGVQTPGGCGWTATSNVDWITIIKISKDNGGGGVTYTVAPSNVSRTDTITVAGKPFIVQQDVTACRYTISPATQTISSGGGVGDFSVTTTSDCSWTATPNAMWVTITSGATGSGNGTVSYSLVQNQSGLSRTATITVADKTFTIVQSSEPAEGGSPTPTPTSSATATSTPTPISSPMPTQPPASPTPAANATATPDASASPSPPPTASPSASPSPSPTAAPPSQPLNIATRGRIEAGDNAMIGGLIITGNQTKKVVIRAIGPSLRNSLASALPDPVLELYARDGTLLARNDNWKDDSLQAAELEAKQIAPADDLESAMVAILAPGIYTAVVHGKNGAAGIGLVEVYDVGPGGDSRLANISTRGRVESAENVLIGGFILGGAEGNTKVLVRAIGPSLANLGISDALPNPTLELRDSNGVLLLANDNWKDQQRTAIEQTGIPPTDDSESAILADLPPGAYTAVVASKDAASGTALIEIYNLP